jgi:hypothetical protein
MATMLDECTSEEQRSVVVVVFFCLQNDSIQIIFINKCFLLMLGSVCFVLVNHDWVEKFPPW